MTQTVYFDFLHFPKSYCFHSYFSFNLPFKVFIFLCDLFVFPDWCWHQFVVFQSDKNCDIDSTSYAYESHSGISFSMIIYASIMYSRMRMQSNNDTSRSHMF